MDRSIDNANERELCLKLSQSSYKIESLSTMYLSVER